MEVIYREGIEQAAPLRQLADEATSCLQEVLGLSADRVSVEWDRAEDASFRSLIILRLFDSTGSVSAVIDPKEVKQLRALESRFRLLWGDLLQIRLQKQLAVVLGNGVEQGDH